MRTAGGSGSRAEGNPSSQPYNVSLSLTLHQNLETENSASQESKLMGAVKGAQVLHGGLGAHALPSPARRHLSDKLRLRNMIKALIIISSVSWDGIFQSNETHRKKRCQASALLKQVR